MGRVATTLLSGCVLAVLSFSHSQAQSPADQIARDREQQERLRRLETLGQRTPEPARRAQEQKSDDEGRGPCFTIDHVAVDGVKRFAPSRIAEITAPYSNRCIGFGAINELLRQLTHLYLDKGFIATRVYVPEQDIAGSRVLRLIVVEGRLADIYLDGKSAPRSGVIGTAFPSLTGKVANIRDIEQGLDQINRLSSANAKTSMLPGRQDGESILNVEVERSRPWFLSVSHSNLGQKSTGLAKHSVSLGFENLLNLNDITTFTYERSGPDYPWGSDGYGKSNSYSGSLSVPYGYWTFGVNGSWYDYASVAPGRFSSPKITGTSSQLGVSADRVLHRGQTSITQLNLGLVHKTTDNFLLGNKLEVGSRQYTVGSIGLSHSVRVGNGLWVFDVDYEQGLNLFGAVDKGAPGAGDAEPRFGKFTGTVSFTRPFEMAKQPFEWSSIATAQYSPDNLFGAEQMSLGGYSNVRGTREGLFFGNNGFFVRNELIWKTMPWDGKASWTQWLGQLRPYAGLDHGQIFEQERLGIPRGSLTSWTVGARLAGGRLNADIGYSRILKSSTEPARKGLFFLSTSLRW